MITEDAWATLSDLCEQAYPREACGWLAGTDPDRLDTVRPAATGGRDHFRFSAEDLLALAAATRGATPPRALFHAHPDGAPTLSAADRAALAPGGVVLHPLPHLVVAVAGRRAHAATLHGWRAGAPFVIAQWQRVGAAWRPR